MKAALPAHPFTISSPQVLSDLLVSNISIDQVDLDHNHIGMQQSFSFGFFSLQEVENSNEFGNFQHSNFGTFLKKVVESRAAPN